MNRTPDISAIAEAYEYFKKDLYATKLTGIEILEVAEGYAKCGLKLTPDHMNAAGQVMGGAIYTLADFTFAVAANFRQSSPTVTCTNHVSYLGTAKGDTLYAETELIRNGRNMCTYDIRITDSLGNLIALVNTTGTHIIPKK